MRQHILPVDVPAVDGIRVGQAVRVEGRLAEVGGEGGVREPPRGSFEVLSSRVRLSLLFRRLRPLLNIFLIDSHLPVMILLLCGNCSVRLSSSSFLLLLCGHQLLRSNNDVISVEVISNLLLICCGILLRRESLGPRLIIDLGFLHLIGGLSVDEYAVLVSLLALPLIGAPLNLLDLLVLEALLETLDPGLVPDRELGVLGEAVVAEVLRVAVVPMEHVVHASRLRVLPETLLAPVLRLELGVVLLDQVELDHGMVGLQVRQVARRLVQVVQMLRVSHWAIMRHVLHRLGLGLRGCMRDAQLVQEVVSDDGLPKGHWLVVVLGVNEGLLDSVLHR